MTIVTKVDNVKQSSTGFTLINPDEYGYLRETVNKVIHSFDQEGQAQPVLLTKCLVHWNHKRSPAVSLEDNNDLFWLSHSMDNAEEEVEQETDEYSDDESEYDDDNGQSDISY